MLYSVADLNDDFAEGEIVELRPADVELAEGALHMGASAVVRAIVRSR